MEDDTKKNLENGKITKYMATKVITLLFLLASGIGTHLWAQEKNGPREMTGFDPPPPPDPVVYERGKQFYAAKCGFCHGSNATGGAAGGTNLIRSEAVNHDINGEVIGPIVLNGRPEKGMPKFTLEGTELGDIVTFLHARNREVRYRQLYQTQNILTGSVRAGQAYFNGKGRCYACHSVQGDLAGIAKKYTLENLLHTFLYPRWSPVPVEVTVTMRTGKAFSGTLVHVDEFDVAFRDSAGIYHSFARQNIKVDIHDPRAAHAELLRQYTDNDVHDILAYLETLK